MDARHRHAARPAPVTRTVNYAPPRPAWKTPLAVRRAVITVLAVGFLCATLEWGPPAWHRMETLGAQRRSLKTALAPDRVVYDTDAAAFAPLSTADPQYRMLSSTGPVFWCSNDWMRFAFLMAPPGKRESATLFIGPRNTPAGERRVVVVSAQPSQLGRHVSLDLDAAVILPGNALALAREVGPSAGVSRTGAAMSIPFDTSEHVYVFAGQPDPNDASHFTIAYGRDNGQHLIDGWLFNDNVVKLQDRGGPATAPITPPPPPSAASPRTPG